MPNVKSYKRRTPFGLHQYEIYLDAKSKSLKKKLEAMDEYGFEPNPPIVIDANSKKEAIKKLALPKGIFIREIKRV